MADALDYKTTAITVSAATTTLIVGRNTGRQYLAIQNTGVNPVSFGFVAESPAAAGAGISLDPASAAGGQGGSWEWVDTVPTNPIYAYSTTGTTVVVVEG